MLLKYERGKGTNGWRVPSNYTTYILVSSSCNIATNINIQWDWSHQLHRAGLHEILIPTDVWADKNVDYSYVTNLLPDFSTILGRLRFSHSSLILYRTVLTLLQLRPFYFLFSVGSFLSLAFFLSTRSTRIPYYLDTVYSRVGFIYMIQVTVISLLLAR